MSQQYFTGRLGSGTSIKKWVVAGAKRGGGVRRRCNSTPALWLNYADSLTNDVILSQSTGGLPTTITKWYWAVGLMEGFGGMDTVMGMYNIYIQSTRETVACCLVLCLGLDGPSRSALSCL